MRYFLIAIVCLSVSVSTQAGEFVATGAGGGGQLHSGAFHPEDDDIILVGSDVTGGIYRTDDFGNTWAPCNSGLYGIDELESYYGEDLLGLKNSSFEGFIVATRGGIFQLPYDDNGTIGSWFSKTPMADYYYNHTPGTSGYTHHPDMPIPFSCLDSDRNNFVVAGSGVLRTRSSIETLRYPGLPASSFSGSSHSITDQYTVWKYDYSAPVPTWEPFDTSCTFGVARDISTAVVGTDTCVAVATPDSIMLWTGSSWLNVSDFDVEDLGSTFSNVYPNSLEAWSVHLTPRGTLYAAMEKTGTTLPSGVYRIFDITDPGATWVWVGDGSSVAPRSISMRTMGTYSKNLIYLTVDDGALNEPDILYLGTRYGMYGLSRGSQPYQDVANTGSWTNLVWSDWSTDGISEESGWISDWGAEVLSHPVVSEISPNRLAVPFNGRMHVSVDSGTTWLQRYTVESPTGVWTSRGYNELSVLDVATDTGGKLYSSTGDAGLFRSYDDEWDSFELINPPRDIDTSNTSAEVWSTETAAMEIRKNWRSSGMDAVFVHAGDVIQRLMPGKIMMLYNGTWTNVSATIPDLDHYLFGDLTFSDDQTIFAVYKRYNMRVTDSATVDDNGVVRFDYDDNTGTWNHTYVNNGLGNTGGNRAYGEGISFNQFSGRIFLAARDINSPDGIKRGSLYYLPSSNDSVWTPAFSTSDSTSFRDVRCIGQSRYGNTMYIGTRGHSLAGYGTVLKCTDPSSTPLVVTPMVNSTINNCYFDFDVPAGFTWTDLVANQRLTHVKSLTVDPENKDKVYVGLSCYNFMAKEGLWFYDGTDWEHLSDGEIFQGMGVACSTIRTTTPKRLAIGTDGQEIYYTAVVTPVDPPNIKPPKISLRSHMVHGEPGSTMFRFSLPKPDMVMLKIFDIRGRVIKTQNLGHMSQGPQQVVWDGITGAGGRSASGVYFAKIITENDEGNVRFVVVR